MNRFNTVRELVANVVGVPVEQITAATRQADVPEWDSVAHLNLMLSLEDSFGLRLSVDEIARLRSIADMLKFLETACPSS